MGVMKMNTLGERLIDLRKKRRMTQQQVADKIWVSKATISAYELSNRDPSYEVLIKLSKLFGVSTDYLLGLDGKNTISVDGLTDGQIALLSGLIEELRNGD